MSFWSNLALINLYIQLFIWFVDFSRHLFPDILRKQLELSHPETEGVSFVYGTIMTDGNDDYSEEITDTMCVFAEREVGRVKLKEAIKIQERIWRLAIFN